MHIVYVGAFRLPNFDAASSRVLNNAKGMRGVGHSVSFISWGGKYAEDDLCPDEKYRTQGFEYLITDELDSEGGLFSKLNKRIHRGGESLLILKEMQEKPDVIILYNAEFSWTLTMLRFCHKHNIRLVHDITEWFANNEIHITDIIPNYLNMHFLQKRIPNKILISSLLSTYYSTSNNIIIPPLCDKLDKKWSIEITDDRIGKFNGITFIYAGSPLKKDCLHVIINAMNILFKENTNIRFLILGVNKKDYIKDYGHLLNVKDLNPNLLFLGRVSQDIVPAYYKMADFMILIREPTRKSNAGFPTKVAESMISGVPVITNDTSDINKYVANSDTGFIVKGYNEQALVECLKNEVLKLNREEIETMKSKTREKSALFDYRTYRSKMSVFLNNLL